MLLAVILIGLALLIFGVVMYSPSTQWKTMRWFVALGLLLFFGGYIAKDHCASWCGQSKCEMRDSNCCASENKAGCKEMGSCTSADVNGKSCCKGNRDNCKREQMDNEIGDEVAQPSASLPKTTFSTSENSDFPFTVVPSDGRVEGQGVIQRNGSFFFNPSRVNNGIHTITVNGQKVLEVTVTK